MTPQDLAELRALAEARKQRSEADMARICRKEAVLRARLAEMTDQFEAGVRLVSTEVTPMQGLGAYQAWVDFARRRRAATNRELALVLAEKTECRVRLRRDHGRHDALDMLQEETRRERDRTRGAKSQDTTLSHAILKGPRDDLSV